MIFSFRKPRLIVTKEGDETTISLHIGKRMLFAGRCDGEFAGHVATTVKVIDDQESRGLI